MENLAERFYENLILQSQNSSASLKGSETIQQHLEKSFQHYLPSRIPQQKMVFYQLDSSSHITQEHEFVAEIADLKPIQTDKEERSMQSLLTLPINELQAIIQKKKEDLETLAELDMLEQLENEAQMDDEGNFSDVKEEAAPNCNDLWADKYLSMKFFDLLTNEVINRNVMTWFKTWDELVFPNNPKVNLKVPQSMLRHNYWNSNPVPINPQSNFISPDLIYSFKNKKVLLLYGPPGSGKSTLAKVLARMCGYDVKEVNASDERTGEKILDKIKNSTQMNSFFGKGGSDGVIKPTCLIVDEVDGAIGGGQSDTNSKGMQMIVDYLKKCINYQPVKKAKTTGAEEDDDFIENEDEVLEEGEEPKPKQKRKRRDEGVRELVRPIIFICNDLYAKALRPLREIALTVKIAEADRDRLISRLRIICRQEKVQVDERILRELCEETKYDARSCINTLQFMAACQKGKGITASSLKQASGIIYHGKDTFDNIFNVAESLLYNNERHNYNNIRPIADIKGRLQSVGDTELVNDFLFENYNQSVAYFDDDFEKTAFFLDLMSRQDNQDLFIKKTQNYEMMALSFIPAYAFKKYLAGNTNGTRLSYPHSVRSFQREKKRFDSIFSSLLDLDTSQNSKQQVRKVTKNPIGGSDEERFKLSNFSTLQSNLRKADFRRDVLPYVHLMMHPNIRDTNIQLLQKYEREAFQASIEIMIMFNIKLRPDSLTVENNIAMFEPEVGMLVQFKDGRKEYMRHKTQVLIMQNYESVKQRMLVSGGTQIGDIFDRKKAPVAIVSECSLNKFGFVGNTKKRTRAQMSGGDGTGKFLYKFKEGHSKNFKRELNFDFFV